MTLNKFLDDSLPRLVSACFAAGDVIISHYKQGIIPDIKDDGSPSTVADKQAEAILCTVLQSLTQSYPIVAEEDAASSIPPSVSYQTFWLVDPLDGTREFLTETDDFTVNIGLVHGGIPIFGMIYLPVEQTLFFARPNCGVCQMNRSGVSQKLDSTPSDLRRLRMITSRQSRHSPQVFIDKIKSFAAVGTELYAGSSLKFCRIAQGFADFYPRAGRTMIWDTCAGDAIIREIGGMVIDESGVPLSYNSLKLDNPAFAALSPDLWCRIKS